MSGKRLAIGAGRVNVQEGSDSQLGGGEVRGHMEGLQNGTDGCTGHTECHRLGVGEPARAGARASQGRSRSLARHLGLHPEATRSH